MHIVTKYIAKHDTFIIECYVPRYDSICMWYRLPSIDTTISLSLLLNTKYSNHRRWI